MWLHRRPLFVGVSVAFAAVVAGLACSTFGAAGEGAETEAGSRDDGGRDGALVPRKVAVCPPKAFCDSFDDDVAIPRGWRICGGGNKGLATGVLVRDGGLDGSGGFLVTAREGGNGGQQACLRFEQGQALARYEAVIAFSARHIESTGFLLTTRLTTMNPNGSRDVVVDFENDHVRLDQNPNPKTGTCPECDAIDNARVMDDHLWHRYILVVNVHPTIGSADHGDVTLQRDDKIIVGSKLPFDLSKASMIGIDLGLSFAADRASGSVMFDESSFTVIPLP